MLLDSSGNSAKIEALPWLFCFCSGLTLPVAIVTTAQPAPRSTAPVVPPERLPRHIAIIMDGNGRWAQRQNLPRVEGHRRGAETVRRIATRCGELGIERLTLYCLSSENWKRPAAELDFLMGMLSQYLKTELDYLRQQHVRLETIGQLQRLPLTVQRDIAETTEALSDQDGLKVCLAINYGGRAEIVDAVRQISEKVARGELQPAAIDESVVEQHLYTQGMSDPDLLIRTAGEMRISNFLLWQISYSELWVSPKTWPEFERVDLDAALLDYAHRDRRFGGLSPTEAPAC